MMLCQVIDGFSDRMQQAINVADYAELGVLDSACVRFLRDHLPPRDIRGDEWIQVQDSLERLQTVYRQAVQACEQAKEKTQQELHSAGRGRRNMIEYLSVARQLGR